MHQPCHPITQQPISEGVVNTINFPKVTQWLIIFSIIKWIVHLHEHGLRICTQTSNFFKEMFRPVNCPTQLPHTHDGAGKIPALILIWIWHWIISSGIYTKWRCDQKAKCPWKPIYQALSQNQILRTQSKLRWLGNVPIGICDRKLWNVIRKTSRTDVTCGA